MRYENTSYNTKIRATARLRHASAAPPHRVRCLDGSAGPSGPTGPAGPVVLPGFVTAATRRRGLELLAPRHEKRPQQSRDGLELLDEKPHQRREGVELLVQRVHLPVQRLYARGQLQMAHLARRRGDTLRQEGRGLRRPRVLLEIPSKLQRFGYRSGELR